MDNVQGAKNLEDKIAPSKAIRKISRLWGYPRTFRAPQIC